MTFKEFRQKTIPLRKTFPNRHPVFRTCAIYGMILPASPFSYVLSHFKVITANQISLLRVLLCICVLPFFLLSNTFIVLGLIILYFAFISDCIDGQLARYYGTSSLEGSFIDSVTSSILNPSMLIAIGLLSYNWAGNILGLLLVSLIIAIKGSSNKAKNMVIMKILFSNDTSLSINDRSDQDKNIIGNKKISKNKDYGIKNIASILLYDNFFLIFRFIFIVLLGILFNNNALILKLFLSAYFLLIIYTESNSAIHIYKKKRITKFLNEYYPLLYKKP